MLQYTYLIVGGGMTADAAAQGIREVDANGTIGLVGAEPHPPTTARRSPRPYGRAIPRRASGARPPQRALS